MKQPQTRAETMSTSPADQDSFETLVFAVERPALGLALMMVRDRSIAEELVQEAFARVWASPNTPNEEAEFRRWIYRVITNLARDHLRRQTRFARLRLWLGAASDDRSDPIDRWIEDQNIAQNLRRLSPREQLAVYLFYYEDRPSEQLDRYLGTKPGTGRKLLSRAMAKMRKHVAAEAAKELTR
jgi:RNA polymerase sigma-70 factor (ECF subfamily)